MSIRISVDARGPDMNMANGIFELNCPKCNTANSVTFGQVKREESVTCSGCGAVLKLVDERKSVAEAISHVNNAFDAMKSAIEDFGR